jgi:phosphatidate cytidylyltransferase
MLWKHTRSDGGNLGGSSTAGKSNPGLDRSVVTRIATAAVGIPVIIVLVIVGGLIYEAAIVAVALVAAWEAFQMLQGRGHRPALVLGLIMAGLLAASVAGHRPFLLWQATLLIGAIATGVWFLYSAKSHDEFLDWALTIVVALYAGGFISSLLAIRFLGNGTRLVLLVLVLTWAYDTGAFFAGRTFGQTPFMQSISKSKTWEGVAGGLALTIVVAIIATLPAHIRIGLAFVTAVAVGVAAQTGDLFSGTAAFYLFVLAGFH